MDGQGRSVRFSGWKNISCLAGSSGHLAGRFTSNEKSSTPYATCRSHQTSEDVREFGRFGASSLLTQSDLPKQTPNHLKFHPRRSGGILQVRHMARPTIAVFSVICAGLIPIRLVKSTNL